MKHLLLFLILVVSLNVSFAQSIPKGMNYQAVARDQKGQVIPNKDIELKIELSSLQTDREVVYYSENHKVITSQLGLFTLIIGDGKSEKGGYELIPWATEDIFMNVSISDEATQAFTTISSSKLLAVPYAYYAVTASQLLGDEGLDERAAKEEYWMLSGNLTAGKPKPKFGTRDCADIMVVTNNIERMRIECGGNITMENNLTVKNDLEVQNNFSAWGDVILNSNRKDHFTNTIINGGLSVLNRQPVYFSGTLTVDKNVWFKSKLRVDHRTDLNDTLFVNNGAPTFLTGDLTVDKNTWIKGKLRVDKSTNLNDSLTVNNMAPTHFTGTLLVDKKGTFKDQVLLDNATYQTTSINTGALVVNGGVGVGRNLYVGEEFKAFGPVKLESTLDVQGAANFFNNLTVHKYTWLKGRLEVDGASQLDSILNVKGATTMNSTLAVDGATDLKNTLNVDGATDLNTTLNVDGTATTKAINANGQVTIHAEVTGGDGSYGAYPLRVEGSGQGIAIKVTAGTVDNDNNFVTFFNGSGTPVGGIEGETFAERTANPEYAFNQAILIATEVAAGVNLGLAAIPVVVGGLIASTGPCGACLAMAAADLALATANLVAFNVFASENIGVTYSSGSADYAEWLERNDPSEKIYPGEIVGVYGGKITKYTKNAQHYMVISTKPAILGNMPMKGKEFLHEKVAFLGQIPVKVKGMVFPGDYIIPSGLNDGSGIAIDPNKITAAQYREIVGVAWSGSLFNSGVSMINMAIGLNNNDMARLITKIEDNYNSLESRMLALEQRSTTGNQDLKVSASTEIPSTLALQQPLMSREEIALASMPAELSDEVMKEGMDYLAGLYKQHGIDVKKHPGLDRLMNDAEFQSKIIRKTQDNYKINYQEMLDSAK